MMWIILFTVVSYISIVHSFPILDEKHIDGYEPATDVFGRMLKWKPSGHKHGRMQHSDKKPRRRWHHGDKRSSDRMLYDRRMEVSSGSRPSSWVNYVHILIVTLLTVN
ncbi:uncharacterized protein DEA37_0002638 [Paragonimus westermani]|uniref:Uncharacterized protein n=1 Tax=Paragonimus westermani TaxID=34504 RepID=A0A5J4NX82_9TREM|nr:uncharacterized protein DEA37_0002638 [Paragonimus westermani]